MDSNLGHLDKASDFDLYIAGGGDGEEVATGGERWSRGEEDWREEVRCHGEKCHFVKLLVL